MRRVTVPALVAVLLGCLVAPAEAATPDLRTWSVLGRSSCTVVPDEVQILAGPVRGTAQTTIAKVSQDSGQQPMATPSGWTPAVGGYVAGQARPVRGGTLSSFQTAGVDSDLGPVTCAVALYRGRHVLGVSNQRASVTLVLGAHPALVFELAGVRKGQRYELDGYLHTTGPIRPNPRNDEFDLYGVARHSGLGVWRWAPPKLAHFTDLEWYYPHGVGDTPVLQLERIKGSVTAPPPLPAPTPTPGA